MAGTATTEYLVTVTGPAASTYAAVRLSKREAAAVARMARAIAAAASVYDIHPRIDITPMASTGTRQRRLLAAAEREQLVMALGDPSLT